MQTRLLSPDSLWIEMPLSPQTPQLVWQAMASCGLVKGKINSYKEVHFSPLSTWHRHLVEGFTPRDFLSRDNVRVQVKLAPEGGGTRLDFYAAPPKGDIDFGASTRFKRNLLPRLEQLLREVPTDWQAPPLRTETDTVAPIASPNDFKTRSSPSHPELGVIVPIKNTQLSPQKRMVLWGLVSAAAIIIYFVVQ